MTKEKNKNVVPYRRDPEFFFKVGIRYADKKLFAAALKFLNRAVEMDPLNVDYQFNVAGILAELGDFRKSNHVLAGILKNIDPGLTECYFGMACNYFDMGNYKKAKEYFKKYVYYDPEGQFASEVYDALYYLQMHEGAGGDKKKNKKLSKLADEGKRLLDEGSYENARLSLEQAVKMDPEAIAPRNDLSLVYFHLGEINKAIRLAKSVLRVEPKDVFAHCSLALFYAGSGKTDLYEKQMKTLNCIQPKTKKEFSKLLDTYVRLKEHTDIIRILTGYLKDNREPALFHMLSVAFYNLRQYDYAKDVWDTLRELAPQYSVLVEYYGGINRETSTGVREFSEMEYTSRLPEWLEAEYRGKLDSFVQIDAAMFKKVWEKDSTLKDICLYYLYEGNRETKLQILDKLIQMKSSKTNQMLKGLLNDGSLEKDLKLSIKNALGLKGNKENIRDAGKASPEASDKIRPKAFRWKKEWEAIIDCALQNKEFIYTDGYKNELKNIWMNFISRVRPENAPVIKKREIWAAALEYLYCNLHLIRVSKRKLAEKYKISPASITNKLKEFSR